MPIEDAPEVADGSQASSRDVPSAPGWLGAVADRLIRWRVALFVAGALLAGLAVIPASRLQLDESIESFYSPDDPQLIALADFAHEHDYLNLDLSQLDRVDFVCAAQLANTIASFTREGKIIRLIRPNQLVAALFELLNLGGHASIVSTLA